MAISFNSNVDYKKLMDEAIAKGDYVSAAKYEQQRNAKINDMNASGTNKWGATVSTDYAPYLNDHYVANGTYFDYGLTGDAKNQVLSNQDGWLKAFSLGDQTAMDLYHAANEGIRKNEGYSGGVDGSEYIPLKDSYGNGGFTFAPAPTYTDKYQTDIDALLKEILNRDDFSYEEAPTYTDKYTDQINQLLGEIQNRDAFAYDVNADPLYAQYAQQYTQQGQRSMKDTLGQLAARTGGMASSYASSAAQQASDYYMGQLANKVPELQQLAYGMYMDDLNADVQKLGLLQGQSKIDYGRFRDSLNDWSNNRAMAYQQYLDTIDNKVRDMGLMQSMSDTQYDRYRDTMSDWRNDRDFAYGVYRDEIGDSRYDSETAYNQALGMAELLGSMGNFSGYADLGMSADNIAALEQAWKDMQAQKNQNAQNKLPTISYSDWYNSGVRTEAEAYDRALQEGYSNAEAENLAKYFSNWKVNQNDLLENNTGVSNFEAVRDSLKSMQGIVPLDSAQSMADKAYLDGLISEEQYNELQDYIDGHKWL